MPRQNNPLMQGLSQFMSSGQQQGTPLQNPLSALAGQGGAFPQQHAGAL